MSPDRGSAGRTDGRTARDKLSGFWRAGGPALVAGLVILTSGIAVSMAVFYFADWPTENAFDQVLGSVVLAVAIWLVVSLLFLRGFAEVGTADAAAYDELVVRLASLRSRLHALESDPKNAPSSPPSPSPPGAGDRAIERTRIGALDEARELTQQLETELYPKAAGTSTGSPLRWLGGSGYISLWRLLHRAEEAILQAAPKEALYASAVDDDGRLEKTPVDGAGSLLDELRRILGEPKKRRDMADILGDVDKPEGRTLLREIRFVLNCYRDDLFQRLVRVRNHMFATLVYATIVIDGVLGLAILVLDEDDFEDAIAVALTYYLVGALVGLFAELYGASRGQRGAVHDYGLALVRLQTIPVLSGIAAVGGVVLTRLGGTATTTGDNVTLDQIFSLQDYSFGLVVAAIFGLTPGLLLGRLRAETESYKKDIVQSAPGTPSTEKTT